MSTAYIHGGTDAREVARLEKQAAWTASFTFPRFDAKPGMRVLDLACGTGAMAARLLTTFPGISLVGVDLSRSQLAACRQHHPEVSVINGDGTWLPFADETFDRVHCSWMLEHVPDPVKVLRDVHRVLRRAGGGCQFIEVDNRSLSTTPLLRDVHELLAKLNAAQSKAGGDPAIGPRLDQLFRAAGFRHVTLEPVLLHGTQEDPVFLASFVDEFAEIFEGLDESLGATESALIARASSQLRALVNEPTADLRYTAWLARGLR